MGRRGRKKKWKTKRSVSFNEIEERVNLYPAFAIRQYKDTRYWLDTRGHVYYKKGGKKYKPIEIYEFQGYYNFDVLVERKGKTRKKRVPVHRAMLYCYYTTGTPNYKKLTVHHLSGGRYDNSVTNLYACTRLKHNRLELECLEVESNFDFGGEIVEKVKRY